MDATADTTTEGTVTMIATETPLPLTTPYVVPSHCQTRRRWTRLVGSASPEALFHDPNDPTFVATCQPSGWNSHLATPAIGLKSPALTDFFIYFSGEILWSTGDLIYEMDFPACVGSLEAQDQETYTGVVHDVEVPITKGLIIQPAWRIAWEKSDQAVLTPSPPDLPSGASVASWIPGDPSPAIETPECDATCRDPTQGGRAWGQQLMAIIIATPLTFVLVMGGCTAYCCIRNKQKRRRREARLAQQQDRN
ncbi:hypothetical protein GQ607_001465 [Colletotrichum asianum]|uniref:Uncharacterized protein n=1 Tax=Colletotrichum asianum TaxID=702518 RepID=A0A8H3WUE4_9PEZI|nr:hypothetical protein GQ607_001465 [Colletotrichum asianum]